MLAMIRLYKFVKYLFYKNPEKYINTVKLTK